MTTVELMQPELGDALIDVSGGFGVGFDEATVRNVRIEGERISFLLASPDVERTFHVRFKGVEPNKTYSVIWNHGPAMTVTGNELANSGITVGNALLDPSTL